VLGGLKFRKVIVIVALMLLVVGVVLAFLIQESYNEEVVLDKWDPLTPSKLYPQNVTGWAFMALTSGGTFLELNMSASDAVRVRIGTVTIDNVTGEEVWENLIFDHVGTYFNQRVAIVGTRADFLEIKNEGANTVNISGNVKKIGNVYKTFNSYSSLGTLAVLVGLASLIYGVLTKPKKRRSKRKARKNVASWDLERAIGRC
jgi:hypothetical protein